MRARWEKKQYHNFILRLFLILYSEIDRVLEDANLRTQFFGPERLVARLKGLYFFSRPLRAKSESLPCVEPATQPNVQRALQPAAHACSQRINASADRKPQENMSDGQARLQKRKPKLLNYLNFHFSERLSVDFFISEASSFSKCCEIIISKMFMKIRYETTY